MLTGDLKRCDQLGDWKGTVHDRGAWRCFVIEALAHLNDHMDREEKKRKGVRKMRKERGSCAIRVIGPETQKRWMWFCWADCDWASEPCVVEA